MWSGGKAPSGVESRGFRPVPKIKWEAKFLQKTLI